MRLSYDDFITVLRGCPLPSDIHLEGAIIIGQPTGDIFQYPGVAILGYTLLYLMRHDGLDRLSGQSLLRHLPNVHKLDIFETFPDDDFLIDTILTALY